MTDTELMDSVTKLSGENLCSCVHCGKCSAACPFTRFMDVLPDCIVRLVQIGSDEVKGSDTPWVCASCFSCTVTCPMGMDISKVMEAIRERSLRKREYTVDIRKIKMEEFEKMPQILLVANFRKTTG